MSSLILGKNQYQAKVKVCCSDIKLNDLTSVHLPGKDKILFIDTIQTFDIFTHYYGYLEENCVLINWSSVANDYKGIGLADCLFDVRFLMVQFFDREYVSWWDTEYHFNGIRINNVIVFDRSKSNANATLVPTNELASNDSGSEAESVDKPTKKIADNSDSASESEDSNIGTSNAKPKERYFKLINPTTNKTYGRYTGDTPKQAASKAFTKLLRQAKQQGELIETTMPIHLKESTRGSSRKVYGYEAGRVALPEPQEIVITDKVTGQEKTITYNYRNMIKKIPVDQSEF
jgi:hypothetical protein